jgi:hypothetical protein
MVMGTIKWATAPAVVLLVLQRSGRGAPLCMLSLILFQLFVHAPPIYALVRVGTNARLVCPPKDGVQREIGTTEHHLPHVVQTVPTQLAVIIIILRWKWKWK